MPGEFMHPGTKQEKKKVYCSNCHFYDAWNIWSCKKVIKVFDTPTQKQKLYAEIHVQNVNNDCKYYSKYKPKKKVIKKRKQLPLFGHSDKLGLVLFRRIIRFK